MWIELSIKGAKQLRKQGFKLKKIKGVWCVRESEVLAVANKRLEKFKRGVFKEKD